MIQIMCVSADWSFSTLYRDVSTASTSSGGPYNSSSMLRKSSTPSSSSFRPSPTTSHPHSLAGGDIAGSAIGGIGGIALILGLVYWLLRRHRKNQMRDGSSDLYSSVAASSPEPKSLASWFSHTSPATKSSLTSRGTFEVLGTRPMR